MPLLQFNRLLSVYNTQLLNRYASIDPRLSRLGIFVNWWSGDAGLGGRARGFLSSYAWLLQVIEYAKEKRLAPCLEKSPFAPKEPQTVDGHRISFFQDASSDKSLCPIVPEMPEDVRKKLREAKENAKKNEASLSELALGFMEFCSLRWNKGIDILVITA